MANEYQQAGIRAYLLPLRLDNGSGGVACLFSQTQVVEILGPRPVLRIPCSPAYLQGVLAYHDELLPVLDLDTLCGRHPSAQRQQYRQLMVVRTGALDPKTSLPLKAVVAAAVRIQIAKISGQDLVSGFKAEQAPSTLRDSGLLRGFFHRQGESIALLDLDPVVRGVFSDPSGVRCH